MKIVTDISTTSASAGQGWHPGWLFRDGARGAYYDPTDISTLWQDAAGTAPAVIGQPVARMDDLSGNGHHMVQAQASARPVLRLTGDLLSLEFDGADDALAATTPASAWGWAHRAGGVTFGVAAQVSFRPDENEFLIGTMSGASSGNTGVSLNSDNRTVVDNPRDARVMIARGIGGSVAAFYRVHSGADPVKIWTFVTDAGGTRLTGRGFMIQSGWTNPPDTSLDPSLTLFMGGAGNHRLNGRIHAAVVIDRALNAPDEARLRAWLAARAGISA